MRPSRFDMHAERRGVATETLRSDAGRINCFEQLLFESPQFSGQDFASRPDVS